MRLKSFKDVLARLEGIGSWYFKDSFTEVEARDGRGVDWESREEGFRELLIGWVHSSRDNFNEYLVFQKG
jgi:hypothetical protein